MRRAGVQLPANGRGHLVRVDDVGERRRLGAVLLGVPEDADGVQARLGEERLELGEVVLGLAVGLGFAGIANYWMVETE